MKNTIKFLFAVGIVGITASCTDLDVDVESQYTEYPSSEIAQEAKLADVYFHLRGTLGRRYMEAQALSSDEWVGLSFDGGYYDSGTYAHSTLHDFSANDASLGWYDDVAAGITKANQAILDMGGNEGGAGVARARAMRAFYHWILMDSYGDTPILNSIPEDGDVIERKPRAEVAQFIADELEEIIPQLTTEVSENTYGKPTRYMAEALLVKLYINWPVYTASNVTAYDASNYSNDKLNRVVELCDDIINSGNFSLTEVGSQTAGGPSLSNIYRAKFFPNNGPQIKDFIYAMPYDAITQQGFQYSRPRIWRQANKGTSYFGMTLSQSCGGNFSMTPEASNRFTLTGDARNDIILAGTIYMHDPTTFVKTTTPYVYNDSPVVLTKEITLKEENEQLNTGADVNGWSQGYKSIKYFVVDEDYKNGRNQSNDLPIFRLADIILEKAEAITRGATNANGVTAQSLFNQIRSYVGAPQLDHNPSLAEILEERGRELFDENWRRNDMIRFGTFESEYGFHKKGFPTARFDKEVRIFPIPENTLKNNGWTQNAGY